MKNFRQKKYRSVSLLFSTAVLKEQSAPPKPGLHLQDAEHVTSKMVHIVSTLLDGSTYLQSPLLEHTVA